VGRKEKEVDTGWGKEETVESRFGLKRGFGVTPGEVLTISHKST